MVANFLLAWHNAEENGGWDPVDLWRVDTAIAQEILMVLALIGGEHKYPDDLGFDAEIAEVWRRKRGGPALGQGNSPPKLFTASPLDY